VAVNASGAGVTIGGLVGFNNPGATITASRASGNVTSTYNSSVFDVTVAGGLVGTNLGTISAASTPTSSTACSAGATCATGNVSVGAHGGAGGLVGLNQGVITNAFATGIVAGASGLNDGALTALGGLAGGVDPRLPDGVIRVPAGHASTSTLGAMFGPILLERAG